MAHDLDGVVPAFKEPAPSQDPAAKKSTKKRFLRPQVLGLGALADFRRSPGDADQESGIKGNSPKRGTLSDKFDTISNSGAHIFHSITGPWTRWVAWATHGITQRGWRDAAKVVNSKLKKPGAVALMLPIEHTPWSSDEVEAPRRFQERCSASTTFNGKPHRVWVLELADATAMEEESFQLHSLCAIVQNATSTMRPTAGPWLWPLHNAAASTAIMTAYVARMDRLSWWRQALWVLRIFPPPGGSSTERELAKHYGAAVAYVFAWSNLYIRGLWSLVVLLTVAWCFNAKPDEAFSTRGFYWNAVQLGTILWAFFMAAEGHSQRRVLSIGGFDDLANALSQQKLRRQRYRDVMSKSPMRALMHRIPGESLPSEAGSSDSRELCDQQSICTEATAGGDSCRSRAELSEFSVPIRDRISQPSQGRYGWSSSALTSCLPLPVWLTASPPPPRSAGAASRRHGLAAPDPREQAAVRLQAWIRGQQARQSFRSRLLQRALLAAHVGSMLDVLRSRNYSYKRPTSIWDKLRRKLVAGLVGAVIIAVFAAFCAIVLVAFVQLNIYLTFIWGRCLEPEIQRQAKAAGHDMCRDPQFVHGWRGWLAEVCSDVSLAILFDVALAEVAGLIAKFVIRLRNYEWLHDRRYATVMLSLFIEALSKVGMFAIIGLVFLPQWHTSKASGSAFDIAESCKRLPDYKMCLILRGCDASLEPRCCAGSFLCIARQLEFDQRRVMFERAVKGPFFVAPFVRIFVTVFVPMLAGALGKFVHDDAQSGSKAPRWRRWRWKWFIAGICRILALIFYLDPDHVGGLGYIARGWPFGSLSDLHMPRSTKMQAETHPSRDEKELRTVMDAALDQASRKVFEPMDEVMELKINFMFVALFAPIMPLGIVPTLLSRLVEVRSKATKLFFVRRRSWPGESRLLHETQDAFARIAAYVAVVWHTGLFFISYNPQLALWQWWKVLSLWLLATLALIAIFRWASKKLHKLRRRIHRRVFRDKAS